MLNDRFLCNAYIEKKFPNSTQKKIELERNDHFFKFTQRIASIDRKIRKMQLNQTIGMVIGKNDNQGVNGTGG